MRIADTLKNTANMDLKFRGRELKGTKKRNAVMLMSNAKGPLSFKTVGPVPAVDGLHVNHIALHSDTCHSV